MVGQGHVLVALGGCGGDHGLYGVAAVTPIAVQVQVPPQVDLLHQAGQPVFLGHIQLPHAHPQLRRNVGQAEPGVEGGFIGERLNNPGAQVHHAVLVQRQALAVGVFSQPDVVLLAAGEVLEHRTESIAVTQAQVYLDSRFHHHAGLLGAVSHHLLDHLQRDQGIGRVFRLGGRAHQVDVSYGLLPAAQASGGEQQTDARALLSQFADNLFG